MTHQVKAKGKNSNGKDQTIIAVTEIEAITISSSNSNSNKGNSNKGNSNKGSAQATDASNQAASASVSALAAIQTVEPNAPFAASNATVMLPSGAAAPAFANVDLDPARIIEADQTDVFVQQVN